MAFSPGQRSPTFLLDGRLPNMSIPARSAIQDHDNDENEEGDGSDGGDVHYNAFQRGEMYEDDEEEDMVEFQSFVQNHNDNNIVDHGFEMKDHGFDHGFKMKDNSDDVAADAANIHVQPADDDVSAMPEHYYNEVEMFLNRQAPSIKVNENFSDNYNNSNASKSARKLISSKLALNAVSVNMNINNIKSSGYGQTAKKKNMSSSSSSSSSSTTAFSSRPLDTNLLKEAFAYTEMLAAYNATADEEMEMEMMMSKEEKAFNNVKQHRGSGSLSAPDPRLSMRNRNERIISKVSSAYGGSAKGSKGQIKSMVKKLRNQTNSMNPNPNVFQTAPDQEKLNSQHTNKLDFESLVCNFEQGLTLKKLQQDLLESKNSIQKSETFMKQLTKEFGPVISRKGLDRLSVNER